MITLYHVMVPHFVAASLMISCSLTFTILIEILPVFYELTHFQPESPSIKSPKSALSLKLLKPMKLS